MATEFALSNDPATVDAALDRVAREQVRLVDLQFSDIAGGGRVMTIPGDLLHPCFAMAIASTDPQSPVGNARSS